MMTADLLVPGNHRGQEFISARAFADALVETERAWVRSLARMGRFSSGEAEAVCQAMGPLSDEEILALSISAENGGNPVIDLVKVLRAGVSERIDAEAAALVHTGMTSQDVMDTALMLLLSRVFGQVQKNLGSAGDQLAVLVDEHRLTPMMGRTLAQHALPTTFGGRAGGWLQGIAEALRQLDQVAGVLPVSLAGAAGNMAAASAWVPEGHDGAAWLAELTEAFAAELSLAVDSAGGWHTRRTPVQRAAVALADVTLALGKVANDIVDSARNEIGELAEPAGEGRGASSAMAHKRNPVLSVLIRRSALAASQSLGAVYTAAALSHEERSAGAWHAEWEPLRALMNHALMASDMGQELLGGLEVDTAAMLAHIRQGGQQNHVMGNAADSADRAVQRWRSLRAKNSGLEETA